MSEWVWIGATIYLAIAAVVFLLLVSVRDFLFDRDRLTALNWLGLAAGAALWLPVLLIETAKLLWLILTETD